VWVRCCFPRYRYDFLIGTAWKVLLPFRLFFFGVFFVFILGGVVGKFSRMIFFRELSRLLVRKPSICKVPVKSSLMRCFLCFDFTG